MEERGNIIKILEKTKKAIKNQEVLILKELSDRTIHTASISQDPDNIAIAVNVYSLSKIIQKKETEKDKNWNKLISNFILFIDGALNALKKDDLEKFRKELNYLRKEINKFSPNFKQQIKDVFRKASINKASKIYEHGISMEKTASLLGITMFELASYAGQTNVSDVRESKTMDVKSRIKLAMDMFK